MLYRITRITRPNGNPAMDPDSIKRIGRAGYITQMAVGAPLLFAYMTPAAGILRTTPVVKIRERSGRTIQVATRRNIYYFREVDRE